MIEEVDNLLLGGKAILAEADQESNELWDRLRDWMNLSNLVFQDDLQYQTMLNQNTPSEASRYEPGWSRLKWSLNDRIHNLYMIRAELTS